MPVSRELPVLLTGATGFLGGRLYPALVAAGWRVRCAARDVEKARKRFPDRVWVPLDVDDADSIEPAMLGCGATFYLVHHLNVGEAYVAREARAARAFADAARRRKLARIVYMGGLLPKDTQSRHLKSRAATGHLLATSGVPTMELRAAMIIGAGSESWRITRDLAVRWPALVLPAWAARSRSQPVAVDDVVAALVASLSLPDEDVGIYDVPGLETFTAEDVLRRVSHLAGASIITRTVGHVSPDLVGRGLGLMTRADRAVAKELAFGLTRDVLSEERSIWTKLPGHRRTPFDTAARTALVEEQRTVPFVARALERVALRARRGFGPRRSGP